MDVDPVAGMLGAERDSPYLGDYNLPNPIRLLPDESGVLVGSSLFFNAADLAYRTSMGLSVVDGGELVLVTEVRTGQLQARILAP